MLIFFFRVICYQNLSLRKCLYTVHECVLVYIHMCMLEHVHMYTCTHVLMQKSQRQRLTMGVHGCISLLLSLLFFFFSFKVFLPEPRPHHLARVLTQSSGNLPVSGPVLRFQISIVPHHAQLIWCWRSELSPSCLCGRRFLPDPSRGPHAFLFSLFCRFAFAVLVSLGTVFPSRKVWAVPSFHRKIFNSGDLKEEAYSFSSLTSYSRQIFPLQCISTSSSLPFTILSF